jgi:hypothetical protein
MALQIGRAISDGVKRTFTRTGGILFVGLLATQLLVQSSINTAALDLLSSEPEIDPGTAGIGLTLPVSARVAGGLFAVGFVASSAYFVVLSRALTRPTDELSAFPPALYTRRMVRATLSLLVGGAVVGLSVTIGLFLLVLPGLFLAACFQFFIFAVGVEDRGIVGGLRRSWALSRGNRLKLGLLVVLAGVSGGAGGAIGSVLRLIGAPAAADLASAVINSALFLVLYGVIAAAYRQIREDDPDGPDGGRTTTDPGDGTVAAGR